MEHGIIDLDSDFGKELGFTSDKFDGWLWFHDPYVYISFIVSKDEGKGNLAHLFQSITDRGYGIKVPTPFARMKEICVKQGFSPSKEWFDEAGDWSEVWVKEKTEVNK